MDITTIISNYITSDKLGRQKKSDEVGQSRELLGSCLGYMHVAAREAVRQKSKDILNTGLYANVLEGSRQDFRDNLVGLTLLYHSAILIGLDPDEEFKKVADDTDGEGKKLLITYINRPIESKTLRCMGYRTTFIPDFDFINDYLNEKYLFGSEYSEPTDKKIMAAANISAEMTMTSNTINLIRRILTVLFSLLLIGNLLFGLLLLSSSHRVPRDTTLSFWIATVVLIVLILFTRKKQTSR